MCDQVMKDAMGCLESILKFFKRLQDTQKTLGVRVIGDITSILCVQAMHLAKQVMCTV